MDAADGGEERRNHTCLLMIVAVGLSFCDRLIMVAVIRNVVGLQGRVYGDDVPLAMGWHFGHGGGRLIAFVSVVT